VERALGPDADLQEAARRFPYPSLLLVAARRYRATGELRRARRALELAEARGFQDPALYRLWGEIWEEEGKPEEARRCYLKALARAARG
jgi:tetratricopeptide (TPR) repeat protein